MYLQKVKSKKLIFRWCLESVGSVVRIRGSGSWAHLENDWAGVASRGDWRECGGHLQPTHTVHAANCNTTKISTAKNVLIHNLIRKPKSLIIWNSGTIAFIIFPQVDELYDYFPKMAFHHKLSSLGCLWLRSQSQRYAKTQINVFKILNPFRIWN